MKNNQEPVSAGGNNPPSIKMERTYRAALADVWDLWSTAAGIESWWGPEGFTVTVRQLDFRAGGQLVYAMTAMGAAQVEFMKQAGMLLTTEAKITYQEVVPQRRIAYTTHVDFVADAKPYDVRTLVEFEVVGDRVKMLLTFDPMHSAEWTQRAVMGHASQLRKLDELMRQKGGLV